MLHFLPHGSDLHDRLQAELAHQTSRDLQIRKGVPALGSFDAVELEVQRNAELAKCLIRQFPGPRNKSVDTQCVHRASLRPNALVTSLNPHRR
jgi:hypothetical protein